MNPVSSSKTACLDYIKFVFSIFIVFAHYVSEYCIGKIPNIIDLFSSLYIIIVPFFFSCSAYLLFKKMLNTAADGRKRLLIKFVKRNLLLYAAWSLIYVCFQTTQFIIFGATIEEIGKYIINSLTYSTYQTIWFLPALVIGVSIVWCLYNRFGLLATGICSCAAYIVCCFGVSYSNVFAGTPVENILGIFNYYFVSFRNGLFNAVPFSFLGLFIANSGGSKLSFSATGLLTVVSFVLIIGEAFLVKRLIAAENVNTLFFLVPFTFFFLQFCLKMPFELNSVSLWMRKMSTLIFLSQRIFLSAIPSLVPEGFLASVLNANPLIGFLTLMILIMSFSEIIYLLSKKILFFRVLY